MQLQKQNIKTQQKERERSEKKKGTKQKICPECGSKNLIKDEKRAELVCDECSLVVEEKKIDPGPDWRAFDQKERNKKSRVGAPIKKTLHDKGLTTSISYKDKDAYGHSLSSRKKRRMERLRKWQNRILTKDSNERNLKFALGEINRMASSLDIPKSTREVASTIYRKALDNDLLPGRSIEGVTASALYGACKQNGNPVSMGEIVSVSRVDKQEIARTYRYISRELGLKIGPAEPSEFVPKYASKLNLSEETQRKAIDIIKETAKEGLASGKLPKGYAAAAIYLAGILCNQKRTQKEIAEVADVTQVTIRNRYQEQAEVYKTKNV